MPSPCEAEMKIFAKGSHQGGRGMVMAHCHAESGSEIRKNIYLVK